MLCTFFKGGAYFHLVLHILMSKATLKAWNSYNREVNISLEKMFWNEKRGCDLLYEKSLPFSVFGELVFTDGLVFNACFCGQRRYEPFIHSFTMLGFMSKWFFLLFTLFRIPMNWEFLEGIFSDFLIPKNILTWCNRFWNIGVPFWHSLLNYFVWEFIWINVILLY